jgi:hypothetical protein
MGGFEYRILGGRQGTAAAYGAAAAGPGGVRGRHRLPDRDHGAAGRPATAMLDLRAFSDAELGFAMEQTTGWHAAIVCHLMASGRIAPGATPVEPAADPTAMIEALRLRGFEVTESVA